MSANCSFQIAEITGYQFPFEPIKSNMFALVCDDDVLAIDANISPEGLEFIHKHAAKNWIAIFTHEHFDHISGLNTLRDECGRVTVIASAQSSANFAHMRRNMSAHYDALFVMKDEETQALARSIVPNGYQAAPADFRFSGTLEFDWHGLSVKLQSTPGHTKGSICILVNETHIFTGDTLVNGFPAVTKLPGGSRKDYQEFALPFLNSLPEDALIYPGHGEIAPLREIDFARTEPIS